jgi:hypothetical protein
VVVTTHHGTEIVAFLSEPHEHFGLRFGAAILSHGHIPTQVRAESNGTVLQVEEQGAIGLPPGTVFGDDGTGTAPVRLTPCL